MCCSGTCVRAASLFNRDSTLRLVRDMLSEAGAARIRTCVLLRKPTEGAKQTPVDYLGFEIPDAFVVGYGLDYNDLYRNLPDVVMLKAHVLGGR